MPDWCYCNLRITGNTERVKSFLKFVRSDDYAFDFDRLIPYPQKFKNLDKAASEWDKEHPPSMNGRPKNGFNQGGYQWCVLNWGTKWNSGESTIRWIKKSKQKAHVEIQFDTAWSPPIPIVERASEIFPDLMFKLIYKVEYEKRQSIKWKDGTVTDDDSKRQLYHFKLGSLLIAECFQKES